MGQRSRFAAAVLAANADFDALRRSGGLQQACNAIEIPPVPAGQLWAPNRAAMLWLRFLKGHGGIDLHPDYWHMDQGAVEVFFHAVEQALIRGSDPYKAASSFMYYGPGNQVVKDQADPDGYDFVAKAFLCLINAANRGAARW